MWWGSRNPRVLCPMAGQVQATTGSNRGREITALSNAEKLLAPCSITLLLLRCSLHHLYQDLLFVPAESWEPTPSSSAPAAEVAAPTNLLHGATSCTWLSAVWLGSWKLSWGVDS